MSFFEPRQVQVKHLGHESESENIFAFVLGRPADGFDGQTRDGHAHVMIRVLPLGFGLHMVRVEEDDAALFHRRDVVFVRVLVKRQQHVRFIACAQHFAGANAHLENGRAAGNGRGNRHERHDFLFAATGETGEEPADGLNAVLRIASNANDRFRNAGNFRTARRGQSCIAHFNLLVTNRNTNSDKKKSPACRRFRWLTLPPAVSVSNDSTDDGQRN